jgi:hypothetical protein
MRAPLNRVIRADGLGLIYLSAPGQGGPASVSPDNTEPFNAKLACSPSKTWLDSYK